MYHTAAKVEPWKPLESQSRPSYEALQLPLKWQKSRLVVMVGPYDLFHESIPVEKLDRIFAVVLACAVFDDRQHTFQVATRFPERMRDYFASRSPADHLKAWAVAGDAGIHCDDGDVLFSEYVCGQTCHDWADDGTNRGNSPYKPWGYTDSLFPLPNLWLGVVIQDQADADSRIPVLLDAPAAIRWACASPLLGSIDLTRLTRRDPSSALAGASPRLDWVMVGGEIGPHARPVNPQWVRSLRDQCASASVPFYFERWGEWVAAQEIGPDHNAIMKVQRESARGRVGKVHCFPEVDVARVGWRVAGRSLDGRTHDAFPNGFLVTLPGATVARAAMA